MSKVKPIVKVPGKITGTADLYRVVGQIETKLDYQGEDIKEIKQNVRNHLSDNTKKIGALEERIETIEKKPVLCWPKAITDWIEAHPSAATKIGWAVLALILIGVFGMTIDQVKELIGYLMGL
jgi:hypothetical protein